MKSVLLAGEQKSNHTTKGFEWSARTFLQEAISSPDPYMPLLPGNVSVPGAGSQPDARPPLCAATKGCHVFNAECHNGSVRTG